MERPPLEITVRDPARPARAADLLASGDEAPRPNPFTKRRLQALGAVLLVVAAALGTAEVRERRATGAEERRLNRVLDLTVGASRTTSSYDQRRGEAELALQVEVRNDGPRSVVVERGTAGGYVLVRSLVEVPSGVEVSLLLRQTVPCSRTAPPPAVPVDDLRLELRTAGGPRSLSLLMDREAVGDDAARACGFLPLAEAIDAQAYEAEPGGGPLGLAVYLNNRSVEPATLVALDVAPGLRAQLRGPDGGPAVLPLALPPSRPGGFQAGTHVVVRLTVVDCALAAAAAPRLELQLTDASEQFRASVPYEPASLDSLLSTACPT